MMSSNQAVTTPIANGFSAKSIRFGVHSPASSQREELQEFIADRFATVHGARVSHFLPLFLSMSEQLATHGVVGLQPGFAGELFLEHYLQQPIEQAIATAVERPIDRDSVIEIGNLAVDSCGRGFMLFVVMTCVLELAGYQWMVFTATDEVEKLIRRLGFTPTYLGTANAEALGEAGKEWGQYYAHNPKVMVGRLAQANAVARSNPRLNAILSDYDLQIRSLAARLRDHRRVSLRAGKK